MRRGREIDVLQLDAGFVEDVAERHRYQFQMGQQALVVRLPAAPRADGFAVGYAVKT